jgi:hypothetical protein
MPDGLSAMRGTVRTTARLNIRRGEPNTRAPVDAKVEPGTTLNVIGLIDGEAVGGNPRWYAGPNDTFFWSGVCGEFVPEMLNGSPAPTVNRRNDGSIRPLEDAAIKRMFGNPSYREAARGAVVLDQDWINANIVEMPTPFLAALGYPAIKVHIKARPSFERVFAAIAAQNLTDAIRTCAGTFVPRHKGWNPDRGLSSHSWGVAIDLNVAWNGYGATPAPTGAVGSVRSLLPAFAAEGFAWGGDFSPQSMRDGMHFELARLDL